MVARDLATSGAMRVLDAGCSSLAYGFQTARTSSNGGRVRLQLSVIATAVGVIHLLPLSSAADRAAAAPTPIKAAFCYPWFPETWTVNGHRTHYAPDLGYYRTASTR